MKRGLVLTLSLMAIVASQWLQANDSDAVVILQDSAEAHGGIQNIAKIRDARFSGVATTRRGDRVAEYPFITRTRGFNQVRTEVTAPGFEQTSINDGEYGWIVRNGEKQPLFTHQTANRLIEVNPVLGFLGAFAGSQLELSYDGLVDNASGPAHKLTAILRDKRPERLSTGDPFDSRFEISIDAKTMLITGLRYARVKPDPDSEDVVDEYVYSDYRVAEGLRIPFHIEHWRAGRLIKELQLKDFYLMQHGAIFVEP